ncbi:MAG: hypothetical protein PUD53_03995 [Oscillospiraceae bacterium]|nr:hypothetical protein [Oscillospiraceae bacterium]
MLKSSYKKYYLFTLIGVLIASFYPLYMGVKVAVDMITNGTVLQENYPKYIIPYTPIAVAILLGVLLMLFLKGRFALLGGSICSLGAFLGTELLLEKCVNITSDTVVALEDWQMFSCVVPYDFRETQSLTPIDILIGDYDPMFKLHFYLISVVIILSVLNCIYGFGEMVRTHNKKRLKALVLQSVSAVLFLGLCILACFTAFWRDGQIQVSVLSAILMSMFFIVMGVTAGIFVGSFILGRGRLVSVFIPSLVSVVVTMLMYVGELILLQGNLYRFGKGMIFEGIYALVLAPVDIAIIILSGAICGFIFFLLSKKKI